MDKLADIIVAHVVTALPANESVSGTPFIRYTAGKLHHGSGTFNYGDRRVWV